MLTEKKTARRCRLLDNLYIFGLLGRYSIIYVYIIIEFIVGQFSFDFDKIIKLLSKKRKIT